MTLASHHLRSLAMFDISETPRLRVALSNLKVNLMVSMLIVRQRLLSTLFHFRKEMEGAATDGTRTAALTNSWHSNDTIGQKAGNLT